MDAPVDRLQIEEPDPRLVLSEAGAQYPDQAVTRGLLRGPIPMRLWYEDMPLEVMEQTRVVALLTGDFGMGRPIALLCTHRGVDQNSFNVWPLLPAYPAVILPDWQFPLACTIQAIVPDGKRSTVFTGFVVGGDGLSPDASAFSNSEGAVFSESNEDGITGLPDPPATPA